MPLINNWQDSIGFNTTETALTDIQFESIDFAYPNRPEVKVLNNFSLNIKQGQKVALVGSSGCGKSTVTHLLERFYDPLSGQIRMGNGLIKEIDLNLLRSKISIVSQEPVLFDITIGKLILSLKFGTS